MSEHVFPLKLQNRSSSASVFIMDKAFLDREANKASGHCEPMIHEPIAELKLKTSGPRISELSKWIRPTAPRSWGGD